MTTTDTPSPEIRARKAGFASDLAALSSRAIKLITRDPAGVIPALIIPLFFFLVNVGQLQDQTERVFAELDYKAFQLPVAIVFAVTGISRAANLVIDIQEGYFDRLTITPVRRPTLLLGLMVSDFLLCIALCIPVILIAFAIGVRFETGILGILMFLGIAGLWGLAYTGIPYAIALKTGSPAAVNSSFLLFFPFAFLTAAYVPEEALTGWLRTIATVNPVTYLLRGLRALVSEGWDWSAIGGALLAVLIVGALSQSMALAAFRGRIKQS